MILTHEHVVTEYFFHSEDSNGEKAKRQKWICI